jgi:hypothetical protein
MIAHYQDSLVAYGAAFYRNVFWEAGLVGQMLYVEAEEAGTRSTASAATSTIPFTTCSGSHRATGRLLTTSRRVAQSRTFVSPPCLLMSDSASSLTRTIARQYDLFQACAISFDSSSGVHRTISLVRHRARH